MSRYIPVSPFKYIPDPPNNRATLSENKLIAMLMILAVNTICLSLVYPLIAGT
jgi:hypothetical protein